MRSLNIPVYCRVCLQIIKKRAGQRERKGRKEKRKRQKEGERQVAYRELFS